MDRWGSKAQSHSPLVKKYYGPVCVLFLCFVCGPRGLGVLSYGLNGEG